MRNDLMSRQQAQAQGAPPPPSYDSLGGETRRFFFVSHVSLTKKTQGPTRATTLAGLRRMRLRRTMRPPPTPTCPPTARRNARPFRPLLRMLLRPIRPLAGRRETCRRRTRPRTIFRTTRDISLTLAKPSRARPMAPTTPMATALPTREAQRPCIRRRSHR